MMLTIPAVVNSGERNKSEMLGCCFVYCVPLLLYSSERMLFCTETQKVNKKSSLLLFRVDPNREVEITVAVF